MGFLQFLKDWHVREIEWKRESYQIGWIDDRKKLEWLKGELFRKAQVGKAPQELIDAIDAITHSMKCERRQWAINLASGAINFGVNVISVLIIANLLALPICNDSKSRFCQQVNYFPNVVQDYFEEPPKPLSDKESLEILPEQLSK